MGVLEIVSCLEHRPRPIPVTSKVGGYAILYGYSVKESSGIATAELDLYDGADNTSGVFLPITLSSGQSTEDWFGPQGIHFVKGLVPVVASGAVAGVLFMHLPD